MTVTHQLGEHPQTAATADCIDLGLGHPSPALLPAAELAEMAAARIAGQPLLLQYGTVMGTASFRRALARFATAHGLEMSPAEVMVSGGTSLALAVVSQQLSRPGHRVVCGDPTYFLARRIFAASGLDVVGVPVGDDGLCLDRVERELARAPDTTDLIYCMPSFHNPCGVTMPDAHRAALVDLAERYRAVVIADEPYNLLSYRGQPAPASLYAHDRGRGRVVSLGSFSKILAPGARLGWIQAAPGVLERIASHGVLHSGGNPNPIMAHVVLGLLESGFQAAHLARLRRRYAETSAALCRSLRAHLPGARFAEPTGGYFVWVDLGDGVDTTALHERSRAAGVTFTPGSRCAVTRDLSRYLRLCVSFYEPAELELGVARLAEIVSSRT